MTVSTPNLALTLYDSTTDQAVYFSTFRAVLAGTSLSSNFYKIDTAYGVQAAQITALQNTRGSIQVSATYVSPNYFEANSITSITAYLTGITIMLKLDASSNGTVTLNINALGTKSVMKNNSSGTVVNIGAGELIVGKSYLFRYDGTQWIWVSPSAGDQIYVAGSSGNILSVGSDNTILGTLTPSLLVGNTIHSATSKITPVDADEIGLWNSVDSLLNRVTWANVKATLKTYNDTLYMVVVSPSTSGNLLVSNGSSWTSTSLDGDKGDITVSTSGSIWTIDSGSVSLSKMADMATASLIGRNTAGTGSPEVLSASTVRTMLSLVIGTNVQAWNTNLDTWATKTPPSGTVLGTTDVQIATNKRVQRRPYTTTSTATLTPEIDTYDAFYLTAQASALNIANHSTSTPASTERIEITIVSDATPRAITYGTNYVAKGGIALPSTTVASKRTKLGFEWEADISKYNLIALAQEV